jgi:hypothetical protein
MSNERMLANFEQYAPASLPPSIPHDIVGIAPGTRLHRIIRLPNGWRVWIATNDYKYGTYLELHDSGRVCHCTTRVDEGEEVFEVRPSDDVIERKLWRMHNRK